MARPETPQRRLPRTVVVLGIVSFCNDVASDIVIPLIPILLATLLSAGPLALGLVEGVADAVAAFLKLWAGRHSDKKGGRRKPLVLSGYVLSNLARPLLALAGGWLTVLVLRGIDRVGKGIRSAPRDAMIEDVTSPGNKGLAFGFHRMLDNAGAVLGGLVAALALATFTSDLRTVILLSALPGWLGIMLLAFAVRDGRTQAHKATLPPLSWRVLSPRMRRYLLVLGLFTFCRVSETFIVLRGFELGIGTIELLLLWSALNAAKAASAYVGGALSDRVGRRAVMMVSWLAFAASFYFLCRVSAVDALWAVTLFYGCFAGLSEGAERALIGEFAHADERGTAFGWYHLMLGVAAIPAGLAFGALWQWQSAALAFSWAGALAALSAMLLWFWVGPARAQAGG